MTETTQIILKSIDNLQSIKLELINLQYV